jgi:ATP/maltotriose-dependent transcriptional regulator MalT
MADFRGCGELLDRLSVRSPSLVTWQWGLAVAAERTGSPGDALDAVEAGLEVARDFGAPRAVGLLLLARGIAGGSLADVEEAVTTLGASQARLDHARALAELGARLRGAGRDTDAREPLRRALDLAHRCGATGVEERARQELLAAGGRPRRPVLTGADALTPGERRVAEMAASGLTNREIAQALFVTMKAVGWHLRHIYRKLEIADRTEIADRLG